MVKKVNAGAIIGIIVGILVIALGVVTLNGAETKHVSSSDFSKSSQLQFSYSFGADFYTEMFGVTYNTLQQLEDMANDNTYNMAVATNTISSGLEKVNQTLAYVILAIGAGILALSFGKLITYIPDISQSTYTPASPFRTNESAPSRRPAFAPEDEPDDKSGSWD